jgi:hypothetical protein
MDFTQISARRMPADVVGAEWRRRLAELTAPEVRLRLSETDAVVIPAGATEQHAVVAVLGRVPLTSCGWAGTWSSAAFPEIPPLLAGRPVRGGGAAG